MKLLWKNTFKSFWSNKIEAMTIAILCIFLVVTIIGFSGFILFLQNQSKTIYDKGNGGDATISVNPYSNALPGANLGDILGIFDYKVNDDDTINYTYTGPHATENLYSLISTINYIVNCNDTRYSDGSYGKPIGTYQISVDDSRIFEDSYVVNGRKNLKPGALYKIIGLNNFIPNHEYNNYSLSTECFSDQNFFGSKVVNSLAKNYASQYYQKLIAYENSISWWNKPFLNHKSTGTESNTGGISVIDDAKNIPHPNITNVLRWVNKPILVKGKYTNSTRDVDISYQYAKYHDIRIGDIIKVNNVPFNVVGFLISPNYIYPQFSIFNQTPNNKNQCIVYTQSLFYSHDFSSLFSTNPVNTEMSFDIKITSGNKKQILDKLNDRFSYIKHNYDPLSSPSEAYRQYQYNIVNSRNYIYANRTMFIISIKNIITVLSLVFTIIISLASVFSIIVIIKKQTNEDCKKIGILKALGYRSIKISSTYTIIPMFIAFVSIIVGFISSIIFWFIAIYLFSLYLNFDIISFWNASTFKYILAPNFLGIGIGVIFPLLFILIFTYIISFWNVKRKVIDLLANK